MAMPQAEAAKLKELYLRGSHTILEYGLGGSTILALDNPGNIVIGVDTDLRWVHSVSSSISEDSDRKRFHPMHIDLGPTGPWGYPMESSLEVIKKFPQYAFSPWRFAKTHSLNPDIILIDGRFRVSCFLASLLSSRNAVKILFDDYCDRPPYHVVERLLSPAEKIGRLAVFEYSPPLNSKLVEKIYEMWEYFLVTA